MSTAHYSRVYWSIRDDDRFAGIYGDNHHLATWLRLLIAADAVWPHPADVPAHAKRGSLEALRAAGIIDLLPGGLFRVHGLDNERTRRAESARTSVSHRRDRSGYERPTNVERTYNEKPTSRAEQSKAEQRDTRATDGAWETASGRSLNASGNFAFGYIDDAVSRHGDTAVSAAIVKARTRFAHIPETNALAAAVKAILDPFPDQKAIAAAEREAEQELTSRRGVEATLRRLHYTHTEKRQDCPACREDAA